MQAETALTELVRKHPDDEERWALEFTNSGIARQRWRVVSLTPIPSAVPDVHPRAERQRKEIKDMMYDTGYV